MNVEQEITRNSWADLHNQLTCILDTASTVPADVANAARVSNALTLVKLAESDRTIPLATVRQTLSEVKGPLPPGFETIRHDAEVAIDELQAKRARGG